MSGLLRFGFKPRPNEPETPRREPALQHGCSSSSLAETPSSASTISPASTRKDQRLAGLLPEMPEIEEKFASLTPQCLR